MIICLLVIKSICTTQLILPIRLLFYFEKDLHSFRTIPGWNTRRAQPFEVRQHDWSKPSVPEASNKLALTIYIKLMTCVWEWRDLNCKNMQAQKTHTHIHVMDPTVFDSIKSPFNIVFHFASYIIPIVYCWFIYRIPTYRVSVNDCSIH